VPVNKLKNNRVRVQWYILNCHQLQNLSMHPNQTYFHGNVVAHDNNIFSWRWLRTPPTGCRWWLRPPPCPTNPFFCFVLVFFFFFGPLRVARPPPRAWRWLQPPHTSRRGWLEPPPIYPPPPPFFLISFF
jgi:hypothetical protein